MGRVGRMGQIIFGHGLAAHWLRVLCGDQNLNLARQGRNQTCREWQVACGKWQAKKSSRLATKFRPSTTERTKELRDLSVEALEARRSPGPLLAAHGRTKAATENIVTFLQSQVRFRLSAAEA